MNPTTILMFNILDIFAELIFIVFQLGVLTRKYLVPAVVYLYVAAEQYLVPTIRIPAYYIQVRKQRIQEENARTQLAEALWENATW